MNEPRELPTVDESTCTGCGDCVELCPTACLGMAGRVAWLPRPGDCISCAACAHVCPADAIAMADAAEGEPGGEPAP